MIFLNFFKDNKLSDILSNLVGSTDVNEHEVYEFQLFALMLAPVIFICTVVAFGLAISWGIPIIRTLPISLGGLFLSYNLIYLNSSKIDIRNRYVIFSILMALVYFYGYYILIDIIGLLFWMVLLLVLLPTLTVTSKIPYYVMAGVFVITGLHFGVTQFGGDFNNIMLLYLGFFIVYFLLIFEGRLIHQIIAKYLKHRIKQYGDLFRQNEEISSLYEEISASEEELQDANSQLVNYNKTIKKKNKELEVLANIDTLTNLPNRKRFFEYVDDLVSAKQSFYVVFIDVDDFKKINDSLGHNVGDLFLIEEAKTIAACVGNDHMLFRIGGDEFAVIIENNSTQKEITSRIQSMIRLFMQGFRIDGYLIRLTASFGIARFPDNGADTTAVLSAADSAMHVVKEQGKNSLHFYDEIVAEQVYDQFNLQTHLYDALEKEEFYLVYQPIHANRSTQLISFESLLRYKSDEIGTMYPDQFIPILEETGLIESVGYWIIEQVVEFAYNLNQLSDSAIKFAVNISAKQLFKEDFYDRVVDIFRQSQLDPSYIIFEVTESVLINDVYTAQLTLNQLRRFGIMFSIDDFGTGYSSLSYLVDLPVDILKIDKSFIQRIDEGDNHQLVDGIISIGKALNLKIVAEGVETEAQLAYLRQTDCTSIQGYYYSKPMTADRIADYIQQL